MKINGITADGDTLIIDYEYQPVLPVNHINITFEVMRKTVIHHWRFEDGETCPNPSIPEGRGRLDPPPRGWYCWVYPEDDREFESWMSKHCPTTDCTHRFNSGDPMYTVYIKDDNEATLFTLKWLD